jgi:DNA-binding MarR family transcriptional regulator
MGTDFERAAPWLPGADQPQTGDRERIDQLQIEVARIAWLLDQMGADRPKQPAAPQSVFHIPHGAPIEERQEHRRRAGAIRLRLRQRRMRTQYFPADLFADPAWDMLLDLYAARIEGQVVSVSSLCIAASVPATTALRWIKTMTDAGLFVRSADDRDGRRIFIGLSDAAFARMSEYFEQLENAGQ